MFLFLLKVYVFLIILKVEKNFEGLLNCFIFKIMLLNVFMVFNYGIILLILLIEFEILNFDKKFILFIEE